MAWSDNIPETVWNRGKQRTTRESVKNNMFVHIPPHPNMTKHELIRVQCYNNGYKLVNKSIGVGAYAKVHLAEVNPDKRTNDSKIGELLLQSKASSVAIKIINKGMIPTDFLKKFLPRELENHTKLAPHPNVVRCYEYFSNGDNVFIVMEYCKNGDLLDLINNVIGQHDKGICQDLTMKIFRQICLGLQHCHNQGIVHRDLKCENILLTEEQDAKITDFGFSRHVEDKAAILRTSCGSYAYAAPEVITSKPYNGVRADIWSLGVILFAMVNGRLPFSDQRITEMEEEMRLQRLRFEKNVSSDCTVLLRRILQYNPEKRPTLEAILEDAWLRGKRAMLPTNKTLTRPQWVRNFSVAKDKKIDTGTGKTPVSCPSCQSSQSSPDDGGNETPSSSPIKSKTRKKIPNRNERKSASRPATWPRSSKEDRQSERSAFSPDSAIMSNYLTVDQEMARLKRAKDRQSSAADPDSYRYVPKWFFQKLKQSGSKLKQFYGTPLTKPLMSGTRDGQTVSLNKDKPVKKVPDIMAECSRLKQEASVPKPPMKRKVVPKSPAKSKSACAKLDDGDRFARAKSPSSAATPQSQAKYISPLLKYRAQTCMARYHNSLELAGSKESSPSLVVTPITKDNMTTKNKKASCSCPKSATCVQCRPKGKSPSPRNERKYQTRPQSVRSQSVSPRSGSPTAPIPKVMGRPAGMNPRQGVGHHSCC